MTPRDVSHDKTAIVPFVLRSSFSISSKLAEGGDPPVARTEHESVRYSFELAVDNCSPDSEPPKTDPTDEQRLEFDREYLSRS